MLRKKDIIIIVVVLLVAGATYGAMMIARGGQTVSGVVEIYAGGELYASAPLDQAGEIRVEQENGVINVISIADGGVSMTFSSCKNQLCVHQGSITAENWTQRALGRTIVCLPNRVLVELALDAGHPSLDMDDLPDI